MRYEHDCKHCISLGEYKEMDLYVCPNFGGTLLARYGVREQYASHPIWMHSSALMTLDWVAVALGRAVEKGLLTIDLPSGEASYTIYGVKISWVGSSESSS